MPNAPGSHLRSKGSGYGGYSLLLHMTMVMTIVMCSKAPECRNAGQQVAQTLHSEKLGSDEGKELRKAPQPAGNPKRGFLK